MMFSKVDFPEPETPVTAVSTPSGKAASRWCRCPPRTSSGALPTAVVDATARDVVTPTAGNYNEGTLALRLAPLPAGVSITGNTLGGTLTFASR